MTIFEKLKKILYGGEAARPRGGCGGGVLFSLLYYWGATMPYIIDAMLLDACYALCIALYSLVLQVC